MLRCRAVPAEGIRLPVMVNGPAAATHVEIYTDGGCVPNPGPGGWGVVLRYGSHQKELWGGEPEPTTNNRMELLAACRALESLNRPAAVRLHTDSQYVRRGITEWIPRWRANGWMTAGRQPVKNADLWRRLEEAAARHEMEWLWVRGHAGDPGNELADALATRGLQEALDSGSVPVPRRKVDQPVAAQPGDRVGDPRGGVRGR